MFSRINRHAPATAVAVSLLLGALIPTGPARAVEVARCNIAAGGGFRTVLVVRDGAETEVLQVGQRGVTRAVLHNKAALTRWAQQELGLQTVGAIAACADLPGRKAGLAGAGGGGAGAGTGAGAGGGNTGAKADAGGNDSGAGGAGDGADQL